MLKRSRSKSFYRKRPGKEQALEFGRTLMPVTGYTNEITKSDAVHMDGEIFPGGRGIDNIFLIFFTLITMQRRWQNALPFLLNNENPPCYGSSHGNSLPREK